MTDFAERFRDLHVDRSSGYDKPHKAVMLLAVIDTIEAAAEPAQELLAEFWRVEMETEKMLDGLAR